LESTTFALTGLGDIQIYGVLSKEILTHVGNKILNSKDSYVEKLLRLSNSFAAANNS